MNAATRALYFVCAVGLVVVALDLFVWRAVA